MGGVDLVVPPSVSAASKKKRLYQVWKGRNKFLCGGRLVFGPDASSLVLSTCLIGGPALTFCIKMAMKISQVEFLYCRAIMVIGLILTILDLSFLFMTSSRNPGIVPRNILVSRTQPSLVNYREMITEEDDDPADSIVKRFDGDAVASNKYDFEVGIFTKDRKQVPEIFQNLDLKDRFHLKGGKIALDPWLLSPRIENLSMDR